MSEQSRTLSIDQALFGYSDGHRLLSTSAELSSDEIYELATKSDLSSDARLTSGDSYVCGFPLRKSSLFAYIKTWSAPEMPRPGCVWSHALILPKQFLFRQVDLGVLQEFFQRPGPERDFSFYRKKINIERLAKSKRAQPYWVNRVIAAYYAAEPLLLDGPPEEGVERAILAIWSQQWPKLRSEFSFRTVFGSSIILDKGLTLRVSMYANEAASSLEDSVDSPEEWRSAVARDAVSPTINPLRRFLWRYGKDITRPRRALVPLTKIHLTLEKPDHAAQLVDLVANYFSAENDAHTLKRDLLGVQSKGPSLVPPLPANVLVRFSMTMRVISAGVVTSEEFQDAISRRKQEEFLDLIVGLGAHIGEFDSETSAIWSAVLANIEISTIESKEFPRGFLIDILSARPELLENFNLDLVSDGELMSLIGLVSDYALKERLMIRLLEFSPSPRAESFLYASAQQIFRKAIGLSIAKKINLDWVRVFERWARDVFSKVLPDLSGALEVSHAVRLINYETNLNVDVREVVLVAGRSIELNSLEDRTALDVFLLTLSLKQGFSESWLVISNVLPRLREVSLSDGFLTQQKAVLDVSLPYIADSWDFNKRILKILRQATRRGYDIGPAIREMQLSEAEFRYATDEDNADLQEVIARIFLPWR